MSSWLAMLQDAAEMFVFLAVELSLLFIVISAGVSLIRQKVPDHKIQQMMGAHFMLYERHDRAGFAGASDEIKIGRAHV